MQEVFHHTRKVS